MVSFAEEKKHSQEEGDTEYSSTQHDDDDDDHDTHKDEKHETEKDDHSDEDDDDHSGEEHEDVISLTATEIKEFDIVIKPVTSGNIASEVLLNGEVAINDEKVTHISSRFGGIIKRVYVNQGDYIRKGKVVATLENSATLTRYNVVSNRSGYVTAKDAAIGEVVDAGEELFVVTDFSTVWVNLSIYQKDLHRIHKKQSVRIIDPFSKEERSGTISYISPTIDEATRTATARITISNKSGAWKPGIFVTGLVAIDSSLAKVRVPRTALHQFEGKTVVFIQDEDGFEPRPVSLNRANEKYVEIIKGLKVGEKVVTKNGFVVKSELGKSEMSSGHNH